MIDKEHLEQAGLRALDLLEDSERLLFDRELRVNPHLRGALRDATDQLAAVALTAPQAVPPAAVWEGIKNKLGNNPSTMGQHLASSLRRTRFQPAWAAAAALAILSSWLGVRNYQLTSRPGHGDPATQASQPRNTWPNTTREGGNAFPVQGSGTGADDPTKIADGGGGVLPGTRMMRVVNPSRVMLRGLDSLRLDGEKSAPTPAGVADLRIMELYPPGSEAPSLRDRSLLVGKVAEAIAASVPDKTPKAPVTTNPAPSSGTPKIEPPAPAILRGGGSAPSSDIVIEQGGTVNISGLNLHPDAQVVHQNFPSDAEFQRYGLTRIDDGRVWDGHGGIWHRQADGRSYVGQRAPDGFQPPDPDDPGTVSASPLRPAPAKNGTDSPPSPTAPSSVDPGVSHPAPEPYALPVISSDGQGMIVTRNLPEPASGYGYALWGHDPAGGRPVLLGYLPQTDGANGIFAFDLPAGLAVPTGYRITTQALNDPSKPGSSILQGP